MTREEFNQALREVASNEFADVLNDTSEHVFSDKFERRMNKLIKSVGKHNTTSFKVFCKWATVIAASILLTATTTVHIMSKYKPAVTMNKYQYSNSSGDYTEITFDGNISRFIACEYEFEYLPEGYHWTRTEITPYSIKREYNNGKKSLHFSQRPASGKMTFQDITLRPLDIEGIDAFMLENEASAIWVQDTYIFSLTCTGSEIDESEIIKMIESLTPIE